MHPGTHPLLRPGVRVCLRDEGLLQVGLDPRWSVRLPDTPAVRALLAGLRDGAAAPRLADLDPRTARSYLDLLDHHLVIDSRGYLAEVARTEQPTHRRFLAADTAAHGSVARHLARAEVTVAVHDRGLGAETALTLLDAAGFTTITHQVSASCGPDPEELPDLVLLLDPDPGDRQVTDGLLARDVAHLQVSCIEGVVRLGPFVVPGKTGCIRCVDAQHAESDPRRPLLVEQYATAAPEWAVAVPLDLLQIALGGAVRDISAWVDGARPTTWSTVLEVDAELTLPRRRCPPHPDCGCCWDLLYSGWSMS